MDDRGIHWLACSENDYWQRIHGTDGRQGISETSILKKSADNKKHAKFPSMLIEYLLPSAAGDIWHYFIIFFVKYI